MARAARKSSDVRRYLRIVTTYEKTVEAWERRGKDLLRRYADDRPVMAAANAVPRFNVLWSNVETLKPFLYSSTPKPIVQTRIPEDEDDVAATAAQVLERALTFSVAEEHFGSTLRNVRDDYLLPGRGTAWARYAPTITGLQVEDKSDVPADDKEAGDEGESEGYDKAEELAFEEVITDYVHWRDFGHTVARTWEEVDCVWRYVRMGRTALVKRFGKEIGGEVPLDCAGEDREVRDTNVQDQNADRALVIELWCKSEKKAFWFTKSHPKMLDERPDPLNLTHFFPCPRPVYATLTTDSLVPIPDYVEYQDQARELDDLTGRIGVLTAAIKAVGVYDANTPALKRLLEDGCDNELIPVENWGGLADKGGLKGAVDFLPMQEIAETLLSLYKARDAVKADLYEITGMSDIVRGNTAPEETATAQKIKSNFATKRLAERQAEVERFARNLIDIMGNIIANRFAPTTLAKMTGMKLLPSVQAKQELQAAHQAAQQPQQSPQPQQGGAPAPAAPPAPQIPQSALDALEKPTWEEVIALLRDQPSRRFRIDIETDSMVAADDQQEQAARTQFLTAAGGFLNQAVEAGSQHPEMVPLLGRMLMFGVQGFRVGRDLDDAFEDFIKKMEEQAAQPKPGPPPSPDMIRVQGELKLKQEAQQFDQQMRTQQAQQDAARADADQQHRHQMEVADAQTQAERANQDGQATSSQAQLDAMVDVIVARINALAKIQAAGEAKGATPDPAAAEHQEQQGA
jgi:hypothetical protein